MDIQKSGVKKIAFPSHKVACLKDRIIASMIDISFLSLLFLLLLSPFKKKLLIFQITDQPYHFFILFTLTALILVFSGLLYRVIFTITKGGTPGKLLVGLQVVNIWSGNPLTVFNVIVREFFWLLDTALLVPHLGLFAHHQRRPLHDRIADSIVISTKGRFANAPSSIEYLLSRTALFVFSCCVCFGLIFYSYSYMIQSIQEKNLLEFLGSHKGYCEAVSDAEATWPYSDPIVSRLEIALTLHSAYLIDNQCLDLEIQNAFYNNEDLDLAYLANAFITLNQSSLSDEYLKKTCQIAPDTQACSLSQIITLWTEKDWKTASQIFHSLDHKKTSPFMKVWAIKHFERVKEFDAEVKMIEQLWHIKPLKEYLMSHRVAALWGLRKKGEARIAFQSALQILPVEDSLKLSSWYCLQQLKENCTDQIISDCGDFANTIRDDSSFLESSLFSLAYIKINVCSRGDELDYIALEDEMVEMPALQFVRGLRLLKDQKIKEAKVAFKNLIQEEGHYKNNIGIFQKHSLYFEEAKETLAAITNNPSDIKNLAENWFKTDILTWNSRTLGLMLFNKAFAINDLTLATHIGSRLFEVDPYNQKLKQDLIVASYKIGQEEKAWKFLNASSVQNHTYHYSNSLSQSYLKNPTRDIASLSLQEEFQNISNDLISKFGAK